MRIALSRRRPSTSLAWSWSCTPAQSATRTNSTHGHTVKKSTAAGVIYMNFEVYIYVLRSIYVLLFSLLLLALPLPHKTRFRGFKRSIHLSPDTRLSCSSLGLDRHFCCTASAVVWQSQPKLSFFATHVLTLPATEIRNKTKPR